MLRDGGKLRFSCRTTIWLSSYSHSCPGIFADIDDDACAKYNTTSLPSLRQGLLAWRPIAAHSTYLPDWSCNWKPRSGRPFCVERSSTHDPMTPDTLTTKGGASCNLFRSLVNSASDGGTEWPPAPEKGLCGPQFNFSGRRAAPRPGRAAAANAAGRRA